MSSEQESRQMLEPVHEVLVCEGCGQPVKQLSIRDASRARLQFFTGEGYVLAVAFECARCQAIIYSDELVLGKFVPPQFRAAIERQMEANLENGHLPQNGTEAVVVSVRKGGRVAPSESRLG